MGLVLTSKTTLPQAVVHGVAIVDHITRSGEQVSPAPAQRTALVPEGHRERIESGEPRRRRRGGLGEARIITS